jgi:hypothetical protein
MTASNVAQMFYEPSDRRPGAVRGLCLGCPDLVGLEIIGPATPLNGWWCLAVTPDIPQGGDPTAPVLPAKLISWEMLPVVPAFCPLPTTNGGNP